MVLFYRVANRDGKAYGSLDCKRRFGPDEIRKSGAIGLDSIHTGLQRLIANQEPSNKGIERKGGNGIIELGMTDPTALPELLLSHLLALAIFREPSTDVANSWPCHRSLAVVMASMSQPMQNKKETRKTGS